MKHFFKIIVKTGLQDGMNLEEAKVHIILVDNKGQKSNSMRLNSTSKHLEQDEIIDSFKMEVPKSFKRLNQIVLFRDQVKDRNWFCDYIVIQDSRGFAGSTMRKLKNILAPGIINQRTDDHSAEYYFPIHRAVSCDKFYEFLIYGTSLPQYDTNVDNRRRDLHLQRQTYEYEQKAPGMPQQIKVIPWDQRFSNEYFWNFTKQKAKLMVKTRFVERVYRKWESFDDMKRIIGKSLGSTHCFEIWDQDWYFGLQRLQGVNPGIISLCKQIPDNMELTEEIVFGLMDYFSLKEALARRKIFICNLSILDKMKSKQGVVIASPIALFYLDQNHELLPIAIQLYQEKGSPIFTPKDDFLTWLVAKMFYNNAEAQHHQGSTHLGMTHIIMEGICVCTHRNLSPSHPVFKLLAPHFLFLLAINNRGLEKLIAPGGWVDQYMSQGREGIFDVLVRSFQAYNMQECSNIKKQCQNRGVLSKKLLPFYAYRDDAVAIWDIIERYVAKIINRYYPDIQKLDADWEIQQWRSEMSKSIDCGGLALKGVPGGEGGGLFSKDNLIEIITIVISTCSVGHAASNFQQYEQYGFVPNYPAILHANPPTRKELYTNEDIVEMLPNMHETLQIMIITKLLSQKGTKSLGDFEFQYFYDPDDIQAVTEFQDDLNALALEIAFRNRNRKVPYAYLDPTEIPNAISI